MTDDQFPMTKCEQSLPAKQQRATRRDSLELYHVIIRCRDEAQQRELFERFRGEGLRCRLTVL